MGGLPAGRVERADHVLAAWEKEVDALLVLLSRQGIIRVDELRRGIEALPPDAYDRLGYYERWIHSITAALVEKGVLTQAEVADRVATIAAREEAER